MTRIKICGITNAEDASAAVNCGADALGFIFVEGSPRYVGDSNYLLSMLRDVPPFVARVGVRRELGACDDRVEKRLDAVQYYSNSLHSRMPAGMRLIRAVSVQSQESLCQIAGQLETDAISALLLDTYRPDKLGGSGETFNWDLAVEAKERFGRPIILAGGLTPDNVGDAIAKVRPYAVDVSSGVEAEPGRKDHAKLQAFIQAVRATDRLLNT